MSGRRLDEDEVIAALRSALGDRRESPEGIGDDGAVLRGEDGRVVALDTLVGGVHFDRRWSDWADVAYKLLATNVSDVWVMGAEPTAFLLSLALPASDEGDLVEGLCRGFADAIDDLGLRIDLVGGDTVRAGDAAVLTATVLGRQVAGPWLRSGARVGDGAWIDAPVGLAAAGLAALSAGRGDEPEMREVVRAHRRPRPLRPPFGASIHATIDVSDGLSLDLMRVARASDVAIQIDAPLPGSDALAPVAHALGASVDDWQLSGGDDYVKVAFTADAPGASWTRIGVVTGRGARLTRIGADGTSKGLSGSGFRHF